MAQSKAGAMRRSVDILAGRIVSGVRSVQTGKDLRSARASRRRAGRGNTDRRRLSENLPVSENRTGGVSFPL